MAEKHGYTTLHQQVLQEQDLLQLKYLKLEAPLTPKDVNLTEYLKEVQKFVREGDS